MTETDLVTSIGDSLTQVDTLLMSGNPPSDSAAWQQLFAMRKHLDDQQRSLVQQTIEADDDQFQAVAAPLQAATKALDSQIAQQATIDTVINTVAQISTYADQILKFI